MRVLFAVLAALSLAWSSTSSAHADRGELCRGGEERALRARAKAFVAIDSPHPTTGRFLSLDPFSGTLDEPLSTQGFTYANANPTRFIDPDGRVGIETVTCGNPKYPDKFIECEKARLAAEGFAGNLNKTAQLRLMAAEAEIEASAAGTAAGLLTLIKAAVLGAEVASGRMQEAIGEPTSALPVVAPGGSSDAVKLPGLAGPAVRDPHGNSSMVEPASDAIPLSAVEGTRTLVKGTREKKRSLTRENESADALERAGYGVEQNPSVRPSDSLGENVNPDLRVNGTIFDVYAPSTADIEGIRDTVNDKTKNRAPRAGVDEPPGPQTRNVVINLGDAPNITPSQVIETLRTRPPSSGNLERVIIIDGQGRVVIDESMK